MNDQDILTSLFGDNPPLLQSISHLHPGSPTPSAGPQSPERFRQGKHPNASASKHAPGIPEQPWAMEDTGEEAPDEDELEEVPKADLSTCYCPVVAISRLPYKYFRSPLSEIIAQDFFNQGKFWERRWDLYYVHPPVDISSRPLLLVPALQVQELVDKINQKFDLSYHLPISIKAGIVLPFKEDGSPQPQLLGQCTSKEIKDQLELNIPPLFNKPDDSHPFDRDRFKAERSWAAFRVKIEAGVAATKKRTRHTKSGKRADPVGRQQDWCRSLRRAQCYLGLRPRRPRDLELEFDNHTTRENREVAEREYALACGTILLPWEVNEPAPFSFANEPIFISIDVEANERCQEQITEIGISVFDTLDLVTLAPGRGGDNWISQIRSRHFRIRERAHIINQHYVTGCPDKFEFGESEWVSFQDAVRVVDGCFQPPYSAHIPTAGQLKKEFSPQAATSLDAHGNDTSDLFPEHKWRPRNIVLVGHDIWADIKHLRHLGSRIFDATAKARLSNNSPASITKPASQTERPNFLEALDTACLFRALKRDTDFRSLGQMLVDVGIMGWHLHNAGNDARYTVESMIRLVLRSRLLLDVGPHQAEASPSWPLGSPLAQIEGSHPDMRAAQALAKSHSLAWEAEVERRVSESAADSKPRIRAECDHWAIAAGWKGERWDCHEDVDGGEGKGIQVSDNTDRSKWRK